MNNANKITLCLVLSLGILACGTSEPCPTCAAPIACPPPAACPPCTACPACPAPVEAVASALILTSARASGPQTFTAFTNVFVQGQWYQRGAATQSGPIATAAITSDYVGYAALNIIKSNPGLSGDISVPGAEDFICKKSGKTVVCWVLLDYANAGPGGKVFVQNTITLL